MPGPSPHGAGLGLRREHIPDLMAGVPAAIDFLELAPENWLDLGGERRRVLRQLAERRPLVGHGLSLNLGGTAPLDEVFLRRVRRFLDQHGIALYTEHLAWCADAGQLYDLLPIPFTAEAVRHVAARIRRSQDILERRIAVENASFYVAPACAEMDEAAFVNAVLTEADCDLHLDVKGIPFLDSRPQESTDQYRRRIKRCKDLRRFVHFAALHLSIQGRPLGGWSWILARPRQTGNQCHRFNLDIVHPIGPGNVTYQNGLRLRGSLGNRVHDRTLEKRPETTGYSEET